MPFNNLPVIDYVYHISSKVSSSVYIGLSVYFQRLLCRRKILFLVFVEYFSQWLVIRSHILQSYGRVLSISDSSKKSAANELFLKKNEVYLVIDWLLCINNIVLCNNLQIDK